MTAIDQISERDNGLAVLHALLAVAAVALGVLVAAVPAHTILLFVISIVAFYLGYQRQDLAVAAIALSVPIQQLVMPGVGTSLVTVTKLVIWFVMAGWLIQKLLTHDPFRFDLIGMTLSLVVLAVALSAWNADAKGYWLGETYRWLATLVVFVIAFDVYRRGASIQPLIAATAIGTLVVTVIAVVQVVLRLGPPSYEVRGFVRAFGPFGHPNQLAIYYELTLPILLAVILLRMRLGPLAQQGGIFSGWWLLLIATALGAGFIGAISTQSRGGGLGVAAGVAAVAFLALFPSHRLIAIAAAAGFGFLIVGLAIGTTLVIYSQDGPVGAPVQVTSANFAVQERLAHWYGAVQMAMIQPILGVGAGNFDGHFREATAVWRFRIGRGHAHNTYLQMLAQSGVVGLAAYLAMLGSVAIVMLRGLRLPSSHEYKAVVIGAAGMTAAMCVHGVFEYVHVLSMSLQLAICWAVVSAGVVRDPAGETRINCGQGEVVAYGEAR